MKNRPRPAGAEYLRIIEWVEEDHCYVGSAPPLIGRCCHGDTAAAVARELDLIVKEWIEIHEQEGEPLPPPTAGKDYSGRFLVRIDPKLHQRLAMDALQKGDSLNQHVTRLLQAA